MHEHHGEQITQNEMEVEPRSRGTLGTLFQTIDRVMRWMLTTKTPVTVKGEHSKWDHKITIIITGTYPSHGGEAYTEYNWRVSLC